MSKHKTTYFTEKLNFFMNKALKQAKSAYYNHEIPVGAIIIHHNQIIAQIHNQTEQEHNFTCHAEMLAIKIACTHLNSKYLDQCSIYITLEPCFMCLHALYLTRIKRIYYGAFNDQDSSVQNYLKLNEKFKIEIYGGIMEEKCGKLLKDFFRK